MFRTIAIASVVVAGMVVTGASAATTFTANTNGGSGTVTNVGPGAYDFGLTLTSNNNGSSGIYTTATTTAAAPLKVSGVWSFTTTDFGTNNTGLDGSNYDPFGYFIDSVQVQLSQDGVSTPAFENGVFSFFVPNGKNWGFYSLATDGIGGSSTGTAYGNISEVPVPAAGFLLLSAFGGIAVMRRRKAKAA